MIDIKNIQGTTILSVPFNSGSMHRKKLMSEDYLLLKFSLDMLIDFGKGDYVEYNGLRYEVTDFVFPNYNTSNGGYEYELRLDAYYWKWKNKVLMYDRQGNNRETSWKLTRTPDAHLDILCSNLAGLEYDYNGTPFEYAIDDSVDQSAKLVSYNDTNIIDALSTIAETWEAEWWVEDNIIHLGRCEYNSTIEFEMGGNVQSMSRSESNDDFATRIYAFGSTRNLPTDYRENEGAVVGGIVQKRLMLPSDTPHIDAYPGLAQEQAVEAVVVFDDVYPRRIGSISSVAIATGNMVDENNNPTGETYPIYTVKDKELKNFKEKYVLDELRLVFSSGSLNGMDFALTLKSSDNTGTSFEIVRNEDYGIYLPHESLKPLAGDEYVLYGFDTSFVSDSYLPAAEKELKKRAEKYIEKCKEDPSVYDCVMNLVAMNGEHTDLPLGEQVTLYNPAYFDENGRKSRVYGFVKHLDGSQLTYTIGNTARYSRLASVENEIKEIVYQGNAYSGSGSGVYVIGSNDSTRPSDRNVLSSTRTLQEIKSRSLSRTYNDNTVGHITFENGILVKSSMNTRQARSIVSVSLTEEGDDAILSTLLTEESDNPEILSTALTEETLADGSFEGGTLGSLDNVDESYDTLPDGKYAFEMRNGILYPIQATDFVSDNVMKLTFVGDGTFTVGLGNEAVIRFNFLSTASDVPTGNGTVNITLNGAPFYTGSIAQGDNAFHVGNALVLGRNTIVVTVEDAYGLSRFLTYTVTAVTLSLKAPNFRWWLAYSGNITIPFLIGGSVNKRLIVTVTGVDNDYSAEYDVNIGTATYTETAYNYAVAHPKKEGVFRIISYVTNSDGSIRTTPVSYSVICVTSMNSKLICINNRASRATNWAENALFEYALYDGSATTTAATFTVYKDGNVVYNLSGDAISTGVQHVFSLPLEVETDDTSDFEIEIRIADEQKELTDAMTFPVTGSYGYTAVPGAALFMNPKTRANTQSNRQLIINEATGGAIAATWNGMNWGNDGWVTDSTGTSVLRIMAGGSVNIDYKPFASEAARTGKTIEIDFKTDNVVDGTEAILSMFTPEGNSYVGYRIAPEEITLFSQSKKDGTTQHLPIDTGVRIRATLTIMPDAYGNSGFNLCCIYINGKKNRVFNYENNDYFAQQGNIVIGSNTADIDVYGIRIYNSALTSEGVQRNYVNWLADNAEKEQERHINDVLDINGLEIDFANTVDQYNCFVFDKSFPRLTSSEVPNGTLEIYFAGNSTPYCTVTNVGCDGQGTSSKKYYEWNVRFRVDKTDSTTTYADGTTDTKNIRLFDHVPKMQRITAKKNWASSMQDHKCGSVNAYNDLFKKLGMTNPAIEADPKVRVAVYQEPFIGFSKELNDDGEWVYTCMGEFTMGPDKGDVACFGFDKKVYPNLIAIEGADNAPFPTLFRVPWREDLIVYDGDEESFQYNGANSWDFNGGNANNISSWIPAYNLVYQCSIRIQPYNGTLAELNADVVNYRSTGYEYWIAKPGDANQYNLYYYEAAQGKFVPSDVGNGIINLYLQLVDEGYGLMENMLAGKSHGEVNELFIKARTEKFRQEMTDYFDLDDAVFHHNFIEFIAGTDNRAKNTYVYHFGTPGEKWKWRQDDLDTIFPIDNQGQDKKPYHCEVHDKYDNGAPMWNGETSNFWNLLELAFPIELATGMRKMLTSMESLSGLSSGTNYDKLYAFYAKYYLGVKNYFPSTLVNSDARRYENAKLAYIAGIYSNDTDPITQSHGDFYSTETAWVKKRILYMMSKYSYGMFSANGNDIITVRAAGDEIIYELVPAMALYPAIANGTSIVRGERTMAGEVCRIPIDLGGSSDQQNNIQGASYLLSIGQWHQKNVSGTMIVQGRRLQEITLGHKTEPVTISITGLTISNCPAVRTILLSNISTLSGVLDVSACSHLKEIYADGTRLAQLKLPEGGGLEVIEYPAYNTYITLRNFPVLRAENVKIGLCKEVVTDFLIQDCDNLNPIDLLMIVMNGQTEQSDTALKRVRAIWKDELIYTNEGVMILDNLAKLGNGSYTGLDGDGLEIENSYPVLDGRLTVNANVYEDSLNTLYEKFSKLVLTVIGKLYVRFADTRTEQICASIWDTDGDGKLTKEEILKATYIPSGRFNGSTMTSFNEFGKYFTGVTRIDSYAFRDTTQLSSITLPAGLAEIYNGAFYKSGIHNIELPDSVTYMADVCFELCSSLRNFKATGLRSTGNYIFQNCSSLQSVELNGALTTLETRMFNNCTSLANVKLADSITEFKEGCFFGCGLKTLTFPTSLKKIGNECFNSCKFVEVELPEGLEELADTTFNNNTQLMKAILPSTLVRMGGFTFRSCTSMHTLVVKAVTPPVCGGNLFHSTNGNVNIYVPDESVAAYKAATGWSGYANNILGISAL